MRERRSAPEVASDIATESQARGTGPLVATTDIQGEGPDLVLIPGGLTGMVSWADHAKRLSRDRRVIRTELLNVELGLQGSPLPPGYSASTEVQAVLNALDELKVANADIVGWSYGGHIALQLAMENPEMVNSLTLVEPPAWWLVRDNEKLWQEAQAFEEIMADFGPDDITEEELERFLHLADIVPQGVDPRSHERWPVWVKYRQSLRMSTVPTRQGVDLELLSRFDKPVLVFLGEGSSEFVREAMRRLVQELPRGRLVELPGAHMLPMVSIDRFLAILREFLVEVS